MAVNPSSDDSPKTAAGLHTTAAFPTPLNSMFKISPSRPHTVQSHTTITTAIASSPTSSLCSPHSTSVNAMIANRDSLGRDTVVNEVKGVSNERKVREVGTSEVNQANKLRMKSMTVLDVELPQIVRRVDVIETRMTNETSQLDLTLTRLLHRIEELERKMSAVERTGLAGECTGILPDCGTGGRLGESPVWRESRRVDTYGQRPSSSDVGVGKAMVSPRDVSTPEADAVQRHTAGPEPDRPHTPPDASQSGRRTSRHMSNSPHLSNSTSQQHTPGFGTYSKRGRGGKDVGGSSGEARKTARNGGDRGDDYEDEDDVVMGHFYSPLSSVVRNTGRSNGLSVAAGDSRKVKSQKERSSEVPLSSHPGARTAVQTAERHTAYSLRHIPTQPLDPAVTSLESPAAIGTTQPCSLNSAPQRSLTDEGSLARGEGVYQRQTSRNDTGGNGSVPSTFSSHQRTGDGHWTTADSNPHLPSDKSAIKTTSRPTATGRTHNQGSLEQMRGHAKARPTYSNPTHEYTARRQPTHTLSTRGHTTGPFGGTENSVLSLDAPKPTSSTGPSVPVYNSGHKPGVVGRQNEPPLLEGMGGRRRGASSGEDGGGITSLPVTLPRSTTSSSLTPIGGRERANMEMKGSGTKEMRSTRVSERESVPKMRERETVRPARVKQDKGASTTFGERRKMGLEEGNCSGRVRVQSSMR
eukprot:GHVN01073483.1.p1 GENE.GHVN01073483.1~~GHVN01073483.1.p1  ORF type:complete len:695 (-),score=138.04 GHVN01073483.1:138-2222(-)